MTDMSIGRAVKRKEDLRFITGKGHYLDDINRQHQLYAAFVRTPHAHAEIKRINKEKALKFLEAMAADGGTNMWSGLEEGLKMKSLVYGDRYDTNVDEMFLVSDGAPNLGDVTDPIEILRIVTETNRFSKVHINTVFITSPNEQDPRDMTITPSELMQRMAAQNGGRFVKL